MQGVSTKIIDGTNLDDDQAESTVELIASNQSLLLLDPTPKATAAKGKMVFPVPSRTCHTLRTS